MPYAKWEKLESKVTFCMTLESIWLSGKGKTIETENRLVVARRSECKGREWLQRVVVTRLYVFVKVLNRWILLHENYNNKWIKPNPQTL